MPSGGVVTGIGQVHGRTVAIVANDATGEQATKKFRPTQSLLYANGAKYSEKAHELSLDAAVKGGTYYPITVKVGKLPASFAFIVHGTMQQSNDARPRLLCRMPHCKLAAPLDPAGAVCQELQQLCCAGHEHATLH